VKRPLGTLAAVLLLPLAARGDDGKEAQRIFETRCASCHTIPDPGLRGDRAWLGQVPRTA